MEGRSTRRGVLTTAGAAVLLAGCGRGDAPPARAPGRAERPTPGDLEILAFLLGVEYFAADFYARLLDDDVLDGEDADTVNELADHEAEHVDTLEGALKELGARRPARAEPDLDRLLTGDPEAILVRAADLEHLGAGAYLSQLARIENQDVLETALEIHTVEGRHAAVLARRVGRSFAPEGAIARPIAMSDVRAELARYAR